jgi:hypothetical protein
VGGKALLPQAPRRPTRQRRALSPASSCLGKSSPPHEGGVQQQHSGDPHAQPGGNRRPRPGAITRSDRRIKPDPENPLSQSNQSEPDLLVHGEFGPPERLHPVGSLRRKHHAIHKVSQDICHDPGDDATEDHTAHVDLSQNTSLSNREGVHVSRPGCKGHPTGYPAGKMNNGRDAGRSGRLPGLGTTIAAGATRLREAFRHV